jgi:hypothetical protein
MSAVIQTHSLVPFIKVFGGAGAGYNSSNISQLKNFKTENGIVKFDKRLRDNSEAAGGVARFTMTKADLLCHEGGF